jgi:hypothetical protein
MNKYVLPSTAALLILVIAVSSFMPAAAVARIVVAPYLQVVTIPEDDQLRQTGIMGLGLNPAGTPTGTKYLDLMSQHKLLITLNGLLVSTTGLVIACNVAEKDKVAVSRDVTTGKTISKNRQFPQENLKTVLIDVAQYFVCKPRWKPGGMSVGVLDVYYTGPLTKDFIADHILVVHVTYTVGRQVFYGTEIQDICVLGWSYSTAVSIRTKTNGDMHYFVDDALKAYASCEEAALQQRAALNDEPFVA